MWQDEERQSSGAEAWEEDDESGPRGSGTLPGSVEEPERRMTKEEILALQEKVGGGDGDGSRPLY